MPHPSLPNGPSPRRLTGMYIAALSLVAVLSVAGQALVQFSLRQQMSNSRVVNIAGRQRMLSQRIAKCMLQLADLHRANDSVGALPAEHDRLVRELHESVARLRASHRGLREGDALLRLPGNNSEGVEAMFAEIDPAFHQLAAAAESAVTAVRDDADDLANTLQALRDRTLQAEAIYLAGVDRIVFQYDREAQARVQRLRGLEIGLLLMTLSVLTLEGCLVFRPAVRRIRHSIEALQSAAERLAVARDEAQQANAAKDQFLSTLSHELRTPMNALVGLTDQLLHDEVRPSQTHKLRTVRRGAQTLTKLLTDLLDASQFGSPHFPTIENHPVDLVELVEQSVALVQPSATEAGLELRVRIDPATPLRVSTDAGRLQQVLLNLLSNAIKYTPAGHVEIAVAPTAVEPPDADDILKDHESIPIVISVSDTGIGIAPEAHRRIFQAFTQLPSARRLDSGGVGLGLFVTSRIVEAMGGRIELESIVDQGSTFRLTLPLAPSSLCLPDRESRTQLSCDEADWSQLDILVAEDNPANQLVLAGYLDDLGCQYKIVSNGRQALEACRREAFDLVMMDRSMPEMDGIESARAIRQQCNDTSQPVPPILGITAHVGTGLREQGAQAGIVGWLSKPFDRTRLVDSIQTCLGIAGNVEPSPHVPAKLYARLQRVALEHLPDLIDQLSVAADEGDCDRIAFLAHRIGGTLSYLTVPKITAGCRSLEAAAEAKQIEQARAELPRIRDLLHSLLARIQHKVTADDTA